MAIALMGFFAQSRARVQLPRRAVHCRRISPAVHRSSLLLSYMLPPLGPPQVVGSICARHSLMWCQEHVSSVLSNFLGYEGVGSLSAWLRGKEFADGECCPRL